MPLVTRVSELATAIRDKINLMMPRLLPAGGAAGSVLVKSSAANYATAWDAMIEGGSHYSIPTAAGNYISPVVTAIAVTTVAGAALRCDFVPFIPKRSVAINQIAIEVTTLLAGSTALIGIYNDSGAWVPGSLLIGGTTTLDCATTGLKAETVSVTLQAGVIYWLAVATSSTTTLRAGVIAAYEALAVNSANGTPFNLRRATLSSMALPATAPATTLTGAITPIMRMRVA